MCCLCLRPQPIRSSARSVIFGVIEGPIKGGETRLTNHRAACDERVAQVFVQRGKEQSAVPWLHVGDIGTVTKLTSVQTGDTLHDKAHDANLPAIAFPSPLFAVAVHPKTKNDAAKLSASIVRLCEEDPSLSHVNDPSTHELLLLGLGQAHIDVAIHHLHNKFSLDVDTTFRGSVTERRLPNTAKAATATKSRPAAQASLPRLRLPWSLRTRGRLCAGLESVWRRDQPQLRDQHRQGRAPGAGVTA